MAGRFDAIQLPIGYVAVTPSADTIVISVIFGEWKTDLGLELLNSPLIVRHGLRLIGQPTPPFHLTVNPVATLSQSRMIQKNHQRMGTRRVFAIETDILETLM